jgi:hypothetical protein
VEAYGDDVVIKMKDLENVIDDLQQVFNSLRHYFWKLNSEKFVFRVPTRKILGFIVIHREIEVNPEKIDTIMWMEPPRS